MDHAHGHHSGDAMVPKKAVTMYTVPECTLFSVALAFVVGLGVTPTVIDVSKDTSKREELGRILGRTVGTIRFPVIVVTDGETIKVLEGFHETEVRKAVMGAKEARRSHAGMTADRKAV